MTRWHAFVASFASRTAILAACALLIAASSAGAQDKGALKLEPLPPLAQPDDPSTPAKELFGRKIAPVSTAARTIGFYSHGCIAGAKALPINGKTWQVMRLSRNRNWGHPNLVQFLERLAAQAPKTGWRGLLVGDMSQPRGGPMRTGHASHQVGLDADIWLTPMPARQLTRVEREEMSATMVVAEDRMDVDPNVWTPAHVAVIKAAAQDPAVQRIFVNAAIKKAICREAKGDRTWLEKVRPMYGHNYHFHVRMRCPSGDNACQDQAPVPGGEGCDKGSLAYWFRPSVLHPKRDANAKPRRGPTMAALPAECRRVLVAK